MSVLSRLIAAARLSPPLFNPLTRGYGSAAAAQLDYDYYPHYDDEESQGNMNGKKMAESEDWETVGRGVQWVIMGDPMVKRHVYAERLAKLLDVPHISMATLLRQELSPRSPLYNKIANAINQGKVVPEDVLFGLLSKRLEEGYCRGETGFILDGIPRTRMQAEILDQVADIDLVLNLKSTEESVLKKTLGKGIYSPREFHIGLQPPLGLLQSVCADSDTVWKCKLRMRAEQRKPLEEYYERQKKLFDFQVGGAPADTWQGLLAALQLQHMNAFTSASNSSHKLTA